MSGLEQRAGQGLANQGKDADLVVQTCFVCLQLATYIPSLCILTSERAASSVLLQAICSQ